jgi:hypothetical protein
VLSLVEDVNLYISTGTTANKAASRIDNQLRPNYAGVVALIDSPSARRYGKTKSEKEHLKKWATVVKNLYTDKYQARTTMNDIFGLL